MSEYKNFHEFGQAQERAGVRDISRLKNKHGMYDIRKAITFMDGQISEYERNSLEEQLQKAKGIRNGLEEKGMLDGSFELTYEGAERIYKRVKDLVEKSGRTSGRDYLSVLERFDPIRDSDLIATGIFCLSPEVREKVSKHVEDLYKVVLNVGTHRHRGYALQQRNYSEPSSNKDFFPLRLRELLLALPKPQNDKDEEYQRALKVLIRKKAERDIFPVFKHEEASALRTLESLASNETNENVRSAYQDLVDVYRNYLDFQVIGVNPNFIDPQTGEKRVLPSLHQKIGIYHLVHEGRFGIWDGGGTGKTAIAVLAQPLIEKEMAKQGLKFKRAIVVGPNLAKKAWKKGLIGKDHERYLEESQDAIILNGERKDQEFLDEIGDKKWIVANYEQLTTKVDGSDRLFIDELADRGVDYVVFDEAHNIKALRELTTKGNPSHSAAARILALSSKYFAPMSATPISNGMNDFAVLYHLLNPAALRDPNQFQSLIQNSPRVLYTFFNERSVRRSSEDINEDLDWSEKEHTVKLDSTQRAIYNHIIEFRPEGWLSQARKALLDPRLVDPEILKRAGYLGRVSVENSAKYRKLEELITSNDGISQGEKFIIFSTMFREGVTQRGHEGLKRKYEQMELKGEYEKLQLDLTLDQILINTFNKKHGRNIEIGIIDGTVPVEERERVVDRLRDGLVGIICTTETGGESLDFTAANHVYFLDEDYVPDTEEQALWRLIRKGQKRKVNISHLRAEDTLDENNRDYVDKKRIIAKMAMDGVPPTEEEWNLLGDTEGKRFGDLIRKSVGGVSINVYDAKIEDASDFEVRKRVISSRRGSSLSPNTYNTTQAQEVMRWIGQDPINCWKNPEFVELYMNALSHLAPPVIHTAKITDLIARSQRGEIVFPRNIVSEGSGPSLLYDSYRRLKPVLGLYGLKIPKVIDRDSSQLMLDRGDNPNQVLADMTGKDSPFRNGQFDMVDNESVSLLKNHDEIHSHLLEASRILKPQGLVELIVKNMRFSDEFYPAMEDLGFEVLSGKNEGFSLSRDAFRRLREKHGETFAESYAAKLANTYLLLGRKIDNPGKVDPKDLWFETLAPEEDEKKYGDTSNAGRSVIHVKSGKRGRWSKPSNSESGFKPEIEANVDRSGVVKSVKSVNGRKK